MNEKEQMVVALLTCLLTGIAGIAFQEWMGWGVELDQTERQAIEKKVKQSSDKIDVEIERVKKGDYRYRKEKSPPPAPEPM